MSKATVTHEPITVVDVLRRAQGYLAERGVDTPRLDAELLLADALGCDRLALYTGFDRPLTTDETDTYRAFIARRARREPVAYILGRRGFRHLTLTVTPDVLVPRPETELLVEWILEVAPSRGSVLDWGTGSGAIALAVATERPDLTVTAIDRSPAALAVARANDTGKDVEWIESDGFSSLSGRTFDLIAANPPYIPEAQMDTLAPELGHEPREALTGGPTGLECYRSITTDAPRHIRPEGWLLCEIGASQAAAVTALMEGAGLTGVQTRRDLAGLDRAIGGHR